MDWLSIVIAILVFVVPALLERDKKKNQRERWEKTDLPDLEDAQESLETRDVQREFAPVDGRDLTEDPYRLENVEPTVQVSAVTGPADTGPAVTEPAVTRPASAVSEVRRKRRLNARDMVIYSEIMRPKYLENREMK